MVKVVEINLLNTHYYLLPEEKLGFYNQPHATIEPRIVQHLLSQDPTIFMTPHSHFLYLIDSPENTQVEGVFSPKCSYLETNTSTMIDDLKTSDVNILEWLQKYWDEPFLLTHPYYQIHDQDTFYIFSSKYGRVLPLTLEDDFYETAIENGCYSVGNGLLLALSMVALGKWKEKDFLQSMELLLDTLVPLDHTLPFYTQLHGDWNSYIEPFPYHMIDHVFSYTFQFNTPSIYRYFYTKCRNEELIVYHVTEHLPAIFLSTLFSDVQRKDQYIFLHEHKQLLKKYHLMVPFFDTTHLQINFAQRIHRILRNQSVYKLFMQKDSFLLKQLKYYVYLNKNMGVLQLARVFLAFDRKYPSRKIFSVLHRLMEVLPNELLKSISYLFLHNIVFKRRGKAYLIPSRKLLRTLVFRNPTFTYFTPFRLTFYLSNDIAEYFPLSYEVLKHRDTQQKVRLTTTWKDVLQVLDTEFGKNNRSILTKRILRKFLLLKEMTRTHSDGNLIQFLMDDHYRTHPESLWK